eukprot:TRINITY_DN17930_c0_g3_i3.p1 TRINITY_DN17930_c0_g3~~TRINITY_DN17930_c0_g3_i3.p1  ORF type:complete len:600 (+),score=98.39 TRINITY_DN17930_c0_g3_i3:192-1991(+)
MLWDCPAWQIIRDKYFPDGPPVGEPIWHSNLIHTEDDNMPAIRSHHGNDAEQDAALGASADPPPAGILYHTDGDYIKWYTDGSCLESDDQMFRTAAYAGWLADGHAFNFASPVKGPIQTNQLAELLGVLKAAINLFADTLILSDSDWVVKRVMRLKEDPTIDVSKWDHAKYWRRLVAALTTTPWRWDIRWVKAHTTQEDVDAGVISQEDKTGNDRVDDMAREAAQAAHYSNELMDAYYAGFKKTITAQVMAADILRKRATVENFVYRGGDNHDEDADEQPDHSEQDDQDGTPDIATDTFANLWTSRANLFRVPSCQAPDAVITWKTHAMGPKRTDINIHKPNEDTRWRADDALYHAIYWYFNGLQFSEGAPRLQREPVPATSYSMMAIDFEMSSGMTLRTPKIRSAKGLKQLGEMFFNLARRVAVLCKCELLPSHVEAAADARDLVPYINLATKGASAMVNFRSGNYPHHFIMKLAQQIHNANGSTAFLSMTPDYAGINYSITYNTELFHDTKITGPRAGWVKTMMDKQKRKQDDHNATAIQNGKHVWEQDEVIFPDNADQPARKKILEDRRIWCPRCHSNVKGAYLSVWLRQSCSGTQ